MTVHRYYEGFLFYSQNVIQFHSTFVNVTLFVPTKKYGPLCADI